MNSNTLKRAALGCALALIVPQLAVAACSDNIAADAPAGRFSVAGDTVTDQSTGLVWKKCSEGQSGAACTGDATSVSWSDALKAAQNANAGSGFGGFTDWRLPNRAELASLLERKCADPAIDTAAFPGTPGQRYWSSSPNVRNAAMSWMVDFNGGDVFPLLKTSTMHVRLVRAGKQ